MTLLQHARKQRARVGGVCSVLSTMKSPESSARIHFSIPPLSFSLLLVLLCLLLVSSSSAAPPHSGSHPHRSSSSASTAATGVRPFSSSSPSSLSSSPRPIRVSSTAAPFTTASSTNAAPAVPTSWTSSSQLVDPVIYGSRMSLARMLSLVFVSLLLVVLVISFIWYFWRKQWLAQREQSQPLSDDGWLRVDESGRIVRDDASHQPAQPYQPSMAYLAPSPTPAALTISYQPYVDVNSERHYVRF